jgi:hypothetical protein
MGRGNGMSDFDALHRQDGEDSAERIIVNIAGGEVFSITGLPNTVRVIVRDWDKGNEPDEHGDLYEDTVLAEGNT